MTNTTTLTVSDYMRAPTRMKRFQEILGPSAEPYVQSVLITVAGSDDLQKCTPESIYLSALRSATLGLSLDPSLKEAWLVPYGKNLGTKERPNWVKEAQFQPHYKGLYKLAMRTGRYLHIHVGPVYEGQRVLQNPVTGVIVVQEENGFIGKPEASNPAYTDITHRRRKDKKIIGWIGYYKMKNGAEKYVYMSVAEIDDHARKYVKDYGNNPNWKDKDKRETMEMKTVLRELLSWTDKSSKEEQALHAALSLDGGDVLPVGDEVVDAQADDQPEMTIQDARNILLRIDGGKERLMGELTVEQLNYVIENSTDGKKIEAARLILREDYNMDAPGAATKRDPKEIIGELMP